MGTASIASRIIQKPNQPACPTQAQVAVAPDGGPTGPPAPPPPPPTPPPPPSGLTPAQVKAGLAAFAAWIPSEALAVYTGVYAIYLMAQGRPTTTGDAATAVVVPMTDRWVTFFIALVVAVILLFFHAALERATFLQAHPGEPAPRLLSGKMYGSIAMMVVAFVLYVANLPGSPFETIVENVGRALPAVLVVAAAPLIPVIAYFAGIRAPRQPE